MGVGGWGVNHALWAIPTTLFPDVWFRVLYKGVYVCPYASISAHFLLARARVCVCVCVCVWGGCDDLQPTQHLMSVDSMWLACPPH